MERLKLNTHPSNPDGFGLMPMGRVAVDIIHTGGEISGQVPLSFMSSDDMSNLTHS